MRVHLYVLLLFLVLLNACNNKADIPNRIDAVNSGNSTITITVSLEIINQLKVLCTDQVAPISYPTPAEHDKAVADCVFQHLSNIGNNASAITGFTNQYCGPSANLSGLTVDQLTSVRATCTALGL